jgi:hypothetical protein
MPGVALLAQGPASASPALAFLCAQIVECLLKAYLTKAGVSEAELRSKAIRHNLDALWSRATSLGLRAQATPPDWAGCLSHLHDDPFYLRYSEKVHAIVLPAAEPMASDLKALLETVRAQLR